MRAAFSVVLADTCRIIQYGRLACVAIQKCEEARGAPHTRHDLRSQHRSELYAMEPEAEVVAAPAAHQGEQTGPGTGAGEDEVIPDGDEVVQDAGDEDEEDEGDEDEDEEDEEEEVLSASFLSTCELL